MNAYVEDPVFWMVVDSKVVAGESEYKGKTNYFYSTGCKETFDKEPDIYIEDELNVQVHQA